jgi:hypothetical protein
MVICCKLSPLPNDCCDGVRSSGRSFSPVFACRPSPKSRVNHITNTGVSARRQCHRIPLAGATLGLACEVSAAAGKTQRLFSNFPFPCNPHKSGNRYFCYQETPYAGRICRMKSVGQMLVEVGLGAGCGC